MGTIGLQNPQHYIDFKHLTSVPSIFCLDKELIQVFSSNMVNIIDAEDDNMEIIGNKDEDRLLFTFDINVDLKYHLITAVSLNVSFTNDMESICINITTAPNGLFPLLWCQSIWEKDVAYQTPDIKELLLTEVRYQNIKTKFDGFKVVLFSRDTVLNQTEEKADLIFEVKVQKSSKISFFYFC